MRMSYVPMSQAVRHIMQINKLHQPHGMLKTPSSRSNPDLALTSQKRPVDQDPQALVGCLQ